MLCRIPSHFCLLLACYHAFCVWRDHLCLFHSCLSENNWLSRTAVSELLGSRDLSMHSSRFCQFPGRCPVNHLTILFLTPYLALALSGTLCWDSTEALSVFQSYSSSQQWKNNNFLHLYLNGQWAILFALNWTIFCYASESKGQRIRGSCFKENV